MVFKRSVLITLETIDFFQHHLFRIYSQKHYWITCLHSITICWDTFVTYNFLNFFWDLSNSKAIKICYIMTIHS